MALSFATKSESRRVTSWAVVLALGLTVLPPGARTDETRLVTQERAELFLALLRRRALKALESHRPPAPTPAPAVPRRWSLSADLSQGYESNPLLDGERRGDGFTQESVSVALTPPVISWLEAEFTHDLLHSHYTELRDANIWMNTLGTAWRLKYHPRLQTHLSYDYSIVNFPFDTSNSFFDHRVALQQQVSWAKWLTQKLGWAYLRRAYDTRKAREGDGTDRPDADRADQRQALTWEWALRLPRTFAKLSGQWYRNLANDASEDFYDWQDWQAQAVISQVLSPHWLVSAVAAHERRNYEARSVPAINVAQRDNLLTLAGSLIYLVNERWQVSYSVTYRYQDSNDPRLDFTDWINQARLSLTF